MDQRLIREGRINRLREASPRPTVSAAQIATISDGEAEVSLSSLASSPFRYDISSQFLTPFQAREARRFPDRTLSVEAPFPLRRGRRDDSESDLMSIHTRVVPTISSGGEAFREPLYSGAT